MRRGGKLGKPLGKLITGAALRPIAHDQKPGAIMRLWVKAAMFLYINAHTGHRKVIIES